MTVLCFVGTETTSLRHDRRAWEIGIIARVPGEADTEHSWFVDARDLSLGNADLMSLKIGRFHERHPQFTETEAAQRRLRDEAAVLREVEAVTRGAHIIGCVPNFDTEVLAAQMRAHGFCPSWHYHLIDVEALAIGWLSRKAANIAATDELSRAFLAPPWKSEDLSRALGVEPPSGAERHTALGDARWARAIWDVVTGETLRQGGGGY